MKRILTILAVFTLCLALGGFAQADLVKNGGFEEGDFTDWLAWGNFTVTGVGENDVHSGNYSAYSGPQATLGYFGQILATTSGQTYEISFWLQNDGGTPNQFVATWDGSTLFDQSNMGSQDYTYYHYTQVASGSETELTFGFRHDPFLFHIDDISVNPVPLPPAVLLLGSGLLGLIGIRRFRG